MIGTPVLLSRFARAVSTYEAEAVVQRAAAERLAGLLGRYFHGLAPRILEIGCGTGLLSRQLMARFAPAELVVNDLCPEMAVCFANVPRARFFPGDARTLEWPGVFDVVASASAVQWFGDLGAFAQRCAAVLPTGGWLAVSCFGPATLQETAALSGKGLEYPSFAQFVEALADGFEPVETAQERQALTFPDGFAVLRHLKATGVTATGAADATPWTRGRMETFARAYAEQFAVPGGVSLTYEPFWFVGRKR